MTYCNKLPIFHVWFQGSVPLSGTMQGPPRMFGMPPPSSLGQQMPPVPPVMGHSPLSTSQIAPSKIDPNQIPRPMPSSSVAQFETRQGNQANIPPVCDPRIFFLVIRAFGLQILFLINMNEAHDCSWFFLFFYH